MVLTEWEKSINMALSNLARRIYLLIGVVVCLRFVFHPPSSAYAVVGIAIAAGMMSLPRSSDGEKTVWVMLLLVLSVIAVIKIRSEESTARNNFSTIVTGLQESVDGLKKVVDQTTGDGSFAYLVITEMITPEFFVEGAYPLHGVEVEIRDQKAMDSFATKRPPTLEEIFVATSFRTKLGELAPYHGEPVYPIPRLLQKKTERDLDVFFLAFNGFWQEKICLRYATNSVPPSRV